MKTYKLFYSWQTDKQETKKIIREALDKAIAKLKVKGIDIYVDQDTRDRIGTSSIDAEVLKKIEACDIFLADISPVTTIGNSKLVPNPNVIFEYGYAKAKIGMKRCILLASLAEGQKIADMPFDINHDTISSFKELSNLDTLHNWIYKITTYVDEERASSLSKNSCKVRFDNYSIEDTVTPIYKRYYRSNSDLQAHNSKVQYSDDWKDYQLKPFKVSGASVIPMAGSAENRSIVPVNLIFINDGALPLDNCEVTLTFQDNAGARFEESDFKSSSFPSGVHFINDPQEITEKQVFQKLGDVNPDAEKELDRFFLHSLPTENDVTLKWKMTSKTHSQEGVITIHVCPQYKDIMSEGCPEGTIKLADYILDK